MCLQREKRGPPKVDLQVLPLGFRSRLPGVVVRQNVLPPHLNYQHRAMFISRNKRNRHRCEGSSSKHSEEG